jgi:uracil-DNA glycosylase family 4
MPRRELNPDLPARCENCVLKDSPLVQGNGSGDGLLILGEAPGGIEAARGFPFVGPAGELLRSTLKGHGVDLDEVYFTNTILCYPPGNKFPGISAIQVCASRLESEVCLVNPKKILTVGGVGLTAATRLSRMATITTQRGRGIYTTWGGRQIYTVPTYHPSAVLRDPDVFRDFANDIEKWLANDSPLPEPNIQLTVPATGKGVEDFLLGVSGHPPGLVESSVQTGYLSCDIETMGVEALRDKIISVGFCAGNQAVIVPPDLLSDPRSLRVMHAVLMGGVQRGTLVLHNMKFDLQFLDILFGEYLHPPRLADTMAWSYCLDERPIGRFKIHGLKALARVHYDDDGYDFDFPAYYKMTPADQKVALPELYAYQAKDVYYTAQLAAKLRHEVEEESPKLLAVAEDLLLPATLAFSDIELRGVQVDIPYLESLQKEVELDVEKRLQDLKVLGKKYGFDDFNPGSPLQVKKLVYETWRSAKAKVTGDVSGSRAKSATTTNRTVLHALSTTAQDPEVKAGLQAIIHYRERQKTLKTYINGILARVGDNGRIHSDFRIIGTATGRISSSNPNLQNIPQLLGTEIRKAFVPTPGYTWVESDFSQLELRVAAALCGDPQLIATFVEGRDVHREVAAMMFSKPPEDVDDFDRDLAKRADFGILYGRTAKALVEGSEFEFLPPGKHWWTIQEAEFFLRQFLDGFPVLRDYMVSVKAKALRDKMVESPLGRRRRFPLVQRKDKGSIERQAFNSPIQGTASDICIRALIDLHQNLPKGAYVLFSIHDAIYLEVRNDLVEDLIPYIKKTMSEAGQKILPGTGVPFDSKLKVGLRWGEAKSWNSSAYLQEKDAEEEKSEANSKRRNDSAYRKPRLVH